jgi:hypothetical protein
VASNGQANVTTGSNAGAFSFSYNILCDGVVKDTAVASGTVVLNPSANAVDDNVGTHASGAVVNYDVSQNDTACDQGANTTFELVPGSAVNCTATMDADGTIHITVA